ncbi:MAG: FAD-dependent oxidoreductase [Chloroflexales bacterium]
MAIVAIVGAGLAGLAAGRALADAGHAVTIFEKSRGVGGRAATRRVDGFSFDHGAQCLMADDPHTAALVAATPGHADIGRPVWVLDGAGQITPGDPALNAAPKWTWTSGLTALPKAMAHGLTVRTEAAVASICGPGAAGRGPGFALMGADSQQLGVADRVLLTPPAPQIADIVRASALHARLRAALLAELGRASYRRCISITFAYGRRPDLPWYALVNADRRHAIAWLACEHAKPGRAPAGAGLLTAQMSHAWSVAHWEVVERGIYGKGSPLVHPLADVAALVRDLAGDLGPPLWADAQRWRYALHDVGCDGDLLNATGSGVYIAGDFLASPARLHLAMQSGRQVAARMLAEL